MSHPVRRRSPDQLRQTHDPASTVNERGLRRTEAHPVLASVGGAHGVQARAELRTGRLPSVWLRSMYLIGHTNPTLIMRVYQQVLDMGDAGVETLEKAIGCSLTDAVTLLSGRGVVTESSPGREKRPTAGFLERAGGRRNRLVAGTSRKRLMGLEPTTFCMASRP
jgi:hypothetical protein